MAITVPLSNGWSMFFRSGLYFLIVSLGSFGAQPIPETPAPAVAVSAAEDPLVLPASTLVPMTLLTEISTVTAKPDDFFQLKVSKAVLIHGRVAIPEGAPAVGQVIDSQPGRMGGARAKLLVTIRYAEVDGKRIAMRLHQPSSGTDHTGASLALSIGIGPLGFLVRGGNAILPAGMELLAKVAKDTLIQPSNANPAATPVVHPEKGTSP